MQESPMDKSATIGFVLIAVVLFAWMYFQAPKPDQQKPITDTTHALTQTPRETTERVAKTAPLPAPAAMPAVDSLGAHFAGLQRGLEKTIIIKTDLYTAEVTTKGGLLKKWELTGYKTSDKQPVQLVDYNSGGDLSLLFTTADGKLINTRNVFWDNKLTAWQTVELKDTESYAIPFTLMLGPGKSLTKRFVFRNGEFTFDTEFEFKGLESVISNYEYQIIWERGIQYAEQNSVDESSFAMGYAFMGGELTELDASKPNEVFRRDISGLTDWVATRNKYFTVAIMPEKGKSEGAYLEGVFQPAPDNGHTEMYSLALKMPFKALPFERSSVKVYLGPLEYDRIKQCGVGLEQIMNLGAAWIIRPISEYVMIPLYQIFEDVHPEFRDCDHCLLDHHQVRTDSVDAHQHEVDAEDAGVESVDDGNTGEVQR